MTTSRDRASDCFFSRHRSFLYGGSWCCFPVSYSRIGSESLRVSPLRNHETA